MKNWFIVVILCFLSVGCSSPPKPPELQENASDKVLGSSFPTVSKKWAALRAKSSQKWLLEWVVHSSSISPVDYQNKTEFLYYAQNSEKIYITGENAQARHNITRYFANNGISPNVIYEYDSDSPTSLVKIVFIKGEQE